MADEVVETLATFPLLHWVAALPLRLKDVPEGQPVAEHLIIGEKMERLLTAVILAVKN